MSSVNLMSSETHLFSTPLARSLPPSLPSLFTARKADREDLRHDQLGLLRGGGTVREGGREGGVGRMKAESLTLFSTHTTTKNRFQRILEATGIAKTLKKRGAKEGESEIGLYISSYLPLTHPPLPPSLPS